MTFPIKHTAADTVARMRAVGIELFGDGWKTKMALALAVSRPTVNNWDWGKFEPDAGRDLDRQLLDLLRAETTAAADRRGRMLAALEKLVADNG